MYDMSNDNSDLLHESSELSVCQTLAMLFNWFCSYPSISKECFDRLLYLLHPMSYAKAKVIIKDMLVPIQSYDCCINDCITYRNCAKGDFAELTHCPSCSAPRYKPNTSSAQKLFKYIPLGPRLKRMFANKKISEILQNHLNDTMSQPPEIVSDLHQSKAWKSMYAVDGPFKGDTRGISFSLCADGTNPFSKEKIAYSMWPIMISLLNLPPHLRNIRGSILLAGIIPGKNEPQNLDPYIDILVEEIKHLNGLRCFDAFRNEEFDLQVDIFMHILDYPGQNKFFHCAGESWELALSQASHPVTNVFFPLNRI